MSADKHSTNQSARGTHLDTAHEACYTGFMSGVEKVESPNIGRKILQGASEAIDTCEVVCLDCKPLRPFECIVYEAECSKCKKRTICRVT